MIFLTLACSRNKVPKGILTKKQITPVLVDIHLAEAIFAQRFALESSRENFQEDLYLSILKKYKIDQKVFEESVLYYGKYPDKYKPIYDDVLNRLNAMSANNRAKDSIQIQIRSAETRAKDSLQIIKMKADSIAKDSILNSTIKADSLSKDTINLIKPVSKDKDTVRGNLIKPVPKGKDKVKTNLIKPDPKPKEAPINNEMRAK